MRWLFLSHFWCECQFWACWGTCKNWLELKYQNTIIKFDQVRHVRIRDTHRCNNCHDRYEGTKHFRDQVRKYGPGPNHIQLLGAYLGIKINQLDSIRHLNKRLKVELDWVLTLFRHRYIKVESNQDMTAL